MERVGISRIVVALAMLMSYTVSAAAQEYVAPAVEVSGQKVKKDGKVYYSHIVKERQTMYSISKAYNVTQEEIFEANPGLKENGLKKNSIIMIPTQSESREIASEQMPSEEQNTATAQQTAPDDDKPKTVEEIGRASCRERV